VSVSTWLEMKKKSKIPENRRVHFLGCGQVLIQVWRDKQDVKLGNPTHSKDCIER
jgi:hypothetical protein